MNTDALYPIGFTLTYLIKKVVKMLISRAAKSKHQQLAAKTDDGNYICLAKCPDIYLFRKKNTWLLFAGLLHQILNKYINICWCNVTKSKKKKSSEGMNTSSRQCSFLQQLKRATGQEPHQGVNICYPNRCEANTLIHSEGSGSLYVSVFPPLPSATSISALSSWKAGGASVYHITGLQDEYRLSNTCQQAKQVNVQPYHNLWLKKYMLLVDRAVSPFFR